MKLLGVKQPYSLRHLVPSIVILLFAWQFTDRRLIGAKEEDVLVLSLLFPWSACAGFYVVMCFLQNQSIELKDDVKSVGKSLGGTVSAIFFFMVRIFGIAIFEAYYLTVLFFQHVVSQKPSSIVVSEGTLVGVSFLCVAGHLVFEYGKLVKVNSPQSARDEAAEMEE